MIEKKHGKLLRTEVKPSMMTFKRHAHGLHANYDHDLLMRYLPPTSGVLSADSALVSSLGGVLPEATVDALRATEFLGIHGRVVESGHGLTCLQYLYVWDYQAVPAHEADYEPIFVFIDDRSHYAIYDLVHYCSRRLDLSPSDVGRPGLQMVPGWHSFLPASSLASSSLDKGVEVQPLSDQHLSAWWSIPEKEARLKIRDYLLDPFQLEAPGHFMTDPDEDAKTICCVFLEIERALKEFDDPRAAIIEGIKRAFAKCVGIWGLFRLGAFIALLNEMNDVGLVNMPTPIRAGLNLAAIGEMLKEGFISITKAGSSFFAGMQSASDEDDDSTGPSVKRSVV
ncbi:MAG: hypothetical protein ACFFAY_11320 [Promethearchaeota archaeon]